MALATAIVSMSDGLEVRDTDKMLSGRIVLLLGTLAFFIVIDVIPRAIVAARRTARPRGRRSSRSPASAGRGGGSASWSARSSPST